MPVNDRSVFKWTGYQSVFKSNIQTDNKLMASQSQINAQVNSKSKMSNQAGFQLTITRRKDQKGRQRLSATHNIHEYLPNGDICWYPKVQPGTVNWEDEKRAAPSTTETHYVIEKTKDGRRVVVVKGGSGREPQARREEGRAAPSAVETRYTVKKTGEHWHVVDVKGESREERHTGRRKERAVSSTVETHYAIEKTEDGRHVVDVKGVFCGERQVMDEY
ncbi:hypothetical protein NHQ30_010142 [Ciborinia camelliae]|nr:hypothetical protein NHQ30_010142 [Ciborinia camelliae]